MLNKRLQAVAQMVDPCQTIADIGCDHAFLAIHLIEKGLCQKVYACDVADGPLKIAKNNVSAANLAEKIDCRLSNGFENIPDDVDIAIIAGMGFHTAKMILEAAGQRLFKVQNIIVQINTDVELFRAWISEHRFSIIDETIVFDRKYYTIIKFNTNSSRALNDMEIEFGPCLLAKKEPEFVAFTKNKLATFEMIAQRITNDQQKKAQIAEKISQYSQVLEKCSAIAN